MFDYVKGLFTAANLAFYYRGVADRHYDSPALMREALVKAVTGSHPASVRGDTEDRIAA